MHGPETGRIHPLKGPVITIGRDEECTIALLDGHLSRRHAMIRLLDGNFVLDDLNSGNGVYINGSRMQRRILHQDDLILIGTTQLAFTLLKPEPPAIP